MMNVQKEEEQVDRNLETIFEALGREPLSDLKFGDVLKQKKWGEDYRYNGDDSARVVFIRYVTPLPGKSNHGERVDDVDIVIAMGVFKKDGSVLMYSVDSRFYEKA